MIELLPTLIPIVLIDVLSPVLFALMLVGVGSSRPVQNSCALLVGHTITYFIVGIVAALGLEKISSWLSNPKPIDFVIGLLVGVGCIYAAFRHGKEGDQPTSDPDTNLSALGYFKLGAAVSFVGAPFAMPYFVAIGLILRADLSTSQSLLVLIGYNILYAIPFALIPLVVATSGDRFKHIFEKINLFMIKGAEFILPLALGLLGFGLVVDAVLYFLRGKGLF